MRVWEEVWGKWASIYSRWETRSPGGASGMSRMRVCENDEEKEEVEE